MSDKIISISGLRNYSEVNEELVSLLEQLLTKSKEGHIKSIAYIASGNGTIESSWVIEDGGNIFEVLGAISNLNSRLIKEVIHT